ncbi:uncharacterized protein LOC121106828 [Gallus gallus]|uniref:uncharacterized protein LOC121106828 n=1 Tax=Gallus gallus TaxID=9031 RepID=UPI001F02C320|nr:uncharacterized protein LOC121106828 [Gallus gallus]
MARAKWQLAFCLAGLGLGGCLQPGRGAGMPAGPRWAQPQPFPAPSPGCGVPRAPRTRRSARTYLAGETSANCAVEVQESSQECKNITKADPEFCMAPSSACLSSDGLGGCTQLEGLCMESPAHCTVTRSPPSLSTSILSRHSAITDPLAMVSRAEQAGRAVACSAQQNCPWNSMLCSAHPQHFMLMQCLTESCGSSAATRRVVGHEEGCGEGQQPAW